MRLNAKDFRGLYSRGIPTECPAGYGLVGYNFMMKGDRISPRPGMNLTDLGRSKSGYTVLYPYEPSPVAGVVTNHKIAHQSFGIQTIFDLDIGITGTPIFGGSPGSAYSSGINFFGRIYIALHNTITGSSTEKVQMYPGGGTFCRDACGIKPTSAMVAGAAGAGNLGVGKYLFNVCFETSSGFITKPSSSVVAKDVFGSASIPLSVIPTGPAGTVARWIIGTRAITLGTYTGNPNDYKFFLLPTGRIPDNTTTVYTANYFDGDLQNSADYLLDLLESIPSGVGIGEYNGRMLVWGENANPSMIRVSKPADPESFSATSGYLLVDPSQAGGVKNCIVNRGTLYIFKEDRCYSVVDNGRDASTWDRPTLLDGGIGTETYGVGRVIDANGNHLNMFLVAGRSGLYIFDGIVRFPELTYFVEDIWRDIDPAQYSKIQVHQDPIHKMIFIILPRNGGIWDILVGDYTEGLQADKIAWSIWENAYGGIDGAVKCAMINMESGSPILWIGQADMLASLNMDNPGVTDQTNLQPTISFNMVLGTPMLIFEGGQNNPQSISDIMMLILAAGPTDITVQAYSLSDPAKPSLVIIPTVLNAPTKIQRISCDIPYPDIMPALNLYFKSTNKPQLAYVEINGSAYGESFIR